MFLNLLNSSEQTAFLKLAFYLHSMGKALDCIDNYDEEMNEADLTIFYQFFAEVKISTEDQEEFVDKFMEEHNETVEKINELADDDPELMKTLLDKKILSELIEEFEYSDEEAKKAVLFELLSLAYGDQEFQEGEQRVFNKIQKAFKIDDEVVEEMKETIITIMDLYKTAKDIIIN